MKACAVCGRTEAETVLFWCGTCGVWLCPRCERNWPARVLAAIRKAWRV